MEAALQDAAVNDEGFLLDHEDWSREMGEAIAVERGLTLTPDHWKVLDAAQADFKTTGKTPGLRRLNRLTGVSIKSLYALFPKGPAKLIAYLGGLPKPKSCL